ncbi:MAG: ribosome biogenesis/translation initiation ATPase RLI [Candidatus Nanohaloarchaea archaeon]
MAEKEQNSKKYIVMIDQDKIEPELARETVIKYDPLNRPGKEGGFYLDENEELHINDDDVMEAHKMAVNKYPYEGAIQMVQLVHEEGDKIHQFGENQFRLHGLPSPEQDSVVGILGENGLGKTVASKILSGKLKPNLGDYEEPPSWEEIKKKYRGTGLQDHLKKLSEDEVNSATKPQQVEKIPEAFSGTVKDFLTRNSRPENLESLIEKFDLEKLEDREVGNLSGGELQRLAIASTIGEEAEMYVFDEPSSFLDVKQRLKTGNEIRSLDGEVFAVEHDLATLDLISDKIHIFYGEKGSYGMVSNALSTKKGINEYLDGHIPSQNLKIRSDSIKFERTEAERGSGEEIISFEPLEKDFGKNEFDLKTSSGSIHKDEIIGIIGENGLGKTVFAKMLAGAIEPDKGESPDTKISYKNQYIEASDKEVRNAFPEDANMNTRRFQTRIEEPLELEPLYERKLENLSGGELQRVAVAICLSRNADAYLLDEPSAFLDVESRVKLGKTLKRFSRKEDKPLLVIDHDLLLLDYISDRGIVFTGEPGITGESTKPLKIEKALNKFLKEVDVTFRRDPSTGRPRANKPGSQKDEKQRGNGNFYEQ